MGGGGGRRGRGEREREGERGRSALEERVFYRMQEEKIRKGKKKKKKEKGKKIQSAPADRSRSDVVTAEEDRTKDIPIRGSFLAN